MHYMGNKLRFLDAIQAAIDDVAAPGAKACDLFAGTAVVARRLAETRPVVCADVQSYSSILARALTMPRVFSDVEVEDMLGLADAWLRKIEPHVEDLLGVEHEAQSAVVTAPELLADIIDGGSLTTATPHSRPLLAAKDRARPALRAAGGTICWYYGGVYFSYRQALELDALRHSIRSFWGVEREPTAVAAVLGIASDAVSTVGNHFAQPIQPRQSDGTIKRGWVTSVMRSREIRIFDGFRDWLARYATLRPTPYECVGLHAEYQQVLSSLGSDVGVIYADPPYTRDHYSRFYHVLETIAQDDDPGVTSAARRSTPSRGLYRQDRHQSAFSVRTRVQPAFRELFSEAKRIDVPLVLSYSPRSQGTRMRPETRLMSIEELMDLAENYFRDVRLLDVESSSHSKFNRAAVNAVVKGSAEVLILARN